MSKEPKFLVSEVLHDEFVDHVVAVEMARLVEMLKNPAFAACEDDIKEDKKTRKAAKRILNYYRDEGLV